MYAYKYADSRANGEGAEQATRSVVVRGLFFMLLSPTQRLTPRDDWVKRDEETRCPQFVFGAMCHLCCMHTSNYVPIRFVSPSSKAGCSNDRSHSSHLVSGGAWDRDCALFSSQDTHSQNGVCVKPDVQIGFRLYPSKGSAARHKSAQTISLRSSASEGRVCVHAYTRRKARCASKAKNAYDTLKETRPPHMWETPSQTQATKAWDMPLRRPSVTVKCLAPGWALENDERTRFSTLRMCVCINRRQCVVLDLFHSVRTSSNEWWWWRL